MAIPSSIDSTTAALIAWYIPRSSQFTMSTRASGGKPSSSLDRTEGAAAAGTFTTLSLGGLSKRFPGLLDATATRTKRRIARETACAISGALPRNRDREG